MGEKRALSIIRMSEARGTREFAFLSRIDLQTRSFSRTEISDSSLAQLHLDAACSRFSSESTNSFSLASMSFAGLSGRFARLGVLSLISSSPWKNLISHCAGLAVEAASLESLHRSFRSEPLAESLAESGGHASFFQNWISHCVNFGSFKLLSSGLVSHSLPAQHFIQSSAMFAGHQLASKLGLEEKSHASLSQQFFDSNLANLQLHAGTALGSLLTGSRLRILERNLESNAHAVLRNPASEALRGLSQLETFRSHVATKTSAFLSAQHQALFEHHSRHRTLKPENSETLDYSDTILRDTIGIEGKSIPFIERLIEVYALDVQRGSVRQLEISRAIAYQFRLRQNTSSSGTFIGSLIQEYVEFAITQESSPLRRGAMSHLFSFMESGCPGNKIMDLFHADHIPSSRFSARNIPPPLNKNFANHFAAEFIGNGKLSAAGYSHEQHVFLLRWVENMSGGNFAAAQRIIHCLAEARAHVYNEALVDDILLLAQTHPLGRLILRRFLHVIAAQDVEAKLAEICMAFEDTLSDRNTRVVIGTLRAKGHLAEAIIPTLLASHHSAYNMDERVARKLIAVTLDTNIEDRYFTAARAEAQANALHYVRDVLIPRLSRRPFATKDLVDFMAELKPNSSVRELLEQIPESHFRIRWVSAAEFTSPTKDCDLSYIDMRPDDGGTPLITIRKIEGLDPHDSLYSLRLHKEVVTRARALIHEWEHWRHLSGNFSGIEIGSEPYVPNGNTRANLIAIETLANLEEERWGFLNDPYNISRRLAHLMGINLPTYYRNLVDITHFLDTNSYLAQAMLE